MMQKLVTHGTAVGIGIWGVFQMKLFLDEKTRLPQIIASQGERKKQPLPIRHELVSSLKKDSFDVLVIGGGATGCGVALDATTRGLKTALVERDDFSSGTSSRSTKLIHGGVRYLQNAIMKLDREQYHLVKEALNERSVMLSNAPHIADTIPILLPVYKWWQVPYFWIGIKAYDFVAGRKLVEKSHFMNKKKVLKNFPTLKSEKLCGGIVYYDGQQDDARMNLLLAITANRHGASCVNHVEVVSLIHNQDSNVCGAHVKDKLTGEEWNIEAKCVVNATGPYTDSVCKMADKTSSKICQPASGVHLVLPGYYCSRNMGLLDPSTSDGRVIFFLPWQGRTVVGTTDRKCDVTDLPRATQNEIDFIMSEISGYFSPEIQVCKSDVLSAWSGIRPLVLDPSSPDTKSLSRNHVVHVSKRKLVTIAGGKWTTYRSMAEDTVNAVVKSTGNVFAKECSTGRLPLEGAEGWSHLSYIKLIQDYDLDNEVAKHLSSSYGNQADAVIKLANRDSDHHLGKRLIRDFPYIEAEVKYSVRNEYACSVVDVLARRLRLAFLDVRATMDVLPRVINIMADELGWDSARKKKEQLEAETFLESLGFQKSS